MGMQSSRASALRNKYPIALCRSLNSFMRARTKWVLTTGAVPRAEAPLKYFSCRSDSIRTPRTLSGLSVFQPPEAGKSCYPHKIELRCWEEEDVVFTTKSGTKTELNHVGHQFHFVFSIYPSGFTLSTTCPDSLQQSHPCCQRHETPLRKSTSWTLVDVWIQTEHDQADTPASGVFTLLKPRKSYKLHF